MKVAVIGAGAMGCLIGGLLAKAGNDVTLVDVSESIVSAIQTRGLRLQDRQGNDERIPLQATTRPETVGTVDLVLIFVKCYHTAAAARSAQPMLGPASVVLSLQNGWGNGPRIADVLGAERLLLGVSYHSATVIEPGVVRHGGSGLTHIGSWKDGNSATLAQIAETFCQANIETRVAPDILKEIWSKLALNVCTLPTSALLRLEANQLVQSNEVVDLMAALLRETTAAARARGIELDYDERWAAITGLLQRCGPGAKSSMLQDVEKRRRTEIDVINGAVVETGRSLQLATPHNDTMVWMVKALEETFPR